MGRYSPANVGGGPLLLQGDNALVLRLLDPALAACALLLGLGSSWAWIPVTVAVATAIVGGTLRPNALGKPYLLFGLALGLNSMLSWPHLGGLFASHAWAMGRPAIAIFLAGAVVSGVRAWGFALLFIAGTVLRSLLGLAGLGPSLEPLLFLPAASLILLTAAWATSSLRGMWRALAGAMALPLVAAIWVEGGWGAWISLALGLVSMAALTRRARFLLASLAAVVVAAASRLLKQEPFSSIDLGSVWGQALALLAKNPAGIGAGNFASRTHEAFAPLGQNFWSHPHNSLLSTWAENGPVGLIAAVWILCALLAALRRGWKVLEEAPDDRQEGMDARALVAGIAGVAGLFAAWSFTDDPLAETVVGYSLGFLLALGLGAAGESALPAQEESLLAVGKGSSRANPLPRKAAAGAAIAIAGAALGGLTALNTTSPAVRLVCGGLLFLLALLHLPELGPRDESSSAEGSAVGGLLSFGRLRLHSPFLLSLRGLLIFVGAALLAVRPFAAPLAPGSAQWWQSSSAAVALCALGAAVAGAGHAIRRPGRIRPAPVAGALTFLGVFAFVGLLDLGALAAVAPGFSPEAPYNFAVAACAVSLVFLAWAGPLAFGEAEVDPRVRRLVDLPAVAVAVGLAATAFLGLG